MLFCELNEKSKRERKSRDGDVFIFRIVSFRVRHLKKKIDSLSRSGQNLAQKLYVWIDLLVWK